MINNCVRLLSPTSHEAKGLRIFRVLMVNDQCLLQPVTYFKAGLIEGARTTIITKSQTLIIDIKPDKNLKDVSKRNKLKSRKESLLRCSMP